MDDSSSVILPANFSFSFEGVLTGGFGCALMFRGTEDLDWSTAAAYLRRLLLRHHLLVIRNLFLAPEPMVRFSRLFGVVEQLPYQPTQLPEHPEIFRVSNDPDHGLTNVGRAWHSDGAYLERPREISILHIVSPPDSGGETQFSNLHSAYEAAPQELRDSLTGRVGVYDYKAGHPLIRPHPVTGRPALYVKLAHPREIVGLAHEQSEHLFERIDALLSRPGGVYTHRWARGDVVVADNFSVAHRALPASGLSLRILHRTTIVGGTRLQDRGEESLCPRASVEGTRG